MQSYEWNLNYIYLAKLFFVFQLELLHIIHTTHVLSFQVSEHTVKYFEFLFLGRGVHIVRIQDVFPTQKAIDQIHRPRLINIFLQKTNTDSEILNTKMWNRIFFKLAVTNKANTRAAQGPIFCGHENISFSWIYKHFNKENTGQDN